MEKNRTQLLPGEKNKQTVALSVNSDQAAFYWCGFYSAKDTLLDDQGRYYFKECFIEGSIDFIFVNGRSLYAFSNTVGTKKKLTKGSYNYFCEQSEWSS